MSNLPTGTVPFLFTNEEAALQSAWAAGQRMILQEAVTYVTQEL